MPGSKPGERRGGRKKGTPNKITRTVREAIEAAFNTLQRDPKNKLTAWARANPTDFYKLAGKLITRDVNLKGELTLRELIKEASEPGS